MVKGNLLEFMPERLVDAIKVISYTELFMLFTHKIY